MAYLNPSRPIAADVLVCADPATAMAIAQETVQSPLMTNHSHGLWGYAGDRPQNEPLGVHAAGIGGPSAALVVSELAAHGMRRAIYVGEGEPLRGTGGAALVLTGAFGADGTSRLLSGGEPRLESADPALTAALREALGGRARPGIAISTDLPGHEPPQSLPPWPTDGALVRDIASAAFLAACRRSGVAAAAALLVREGDSNGSPGSHGVADSNEGGSGGRAGREALVALAAACAPALSPPAVGAPARR